MDTEVQLISAMMLLAWFKLLDYLSVFQTFARLIVMIEMVAAEAHHRRR